MNYFLLPSRWQIGSQKALFFLNLFTFFVDKFLKSKYEDAGVMLLN